MQKRMPHLQGLSTDNARAILAATTAPLRLEHSPRRRVCYTALYSLFSLPKQSDGGGGEFDWDPETQGLILGTFFYGYAFSHVPGGVLAERYGGKWFMGMFNLGRPLIHDVLLNVLWKIPPAGGPIL